MPPAVDPGRARRAGFLAVGAPGEYCEQTEQEQRFPTLWRVLTTER